MTSFKQFLNESFKNYFSIEDKQVWAEKAFAQLENSYKNIGGLKGAEFKNVDTFLKANLFWKLNIINGELVAAAYYKDKAGRKRIAISSNGTKRAKEIITEIMVNDLLLGRSWVEQSSNSLAFLVKEVGFDFVKKYILTAEQIEKLTGAETRKPPEDDKEIQRHPELAKFFYQRRIAGEWKTKLALGTINTTN